MVVVVVVVMVDRFGVLVLVDRFGVLVLVVTLSSLPIPSISVPLVLEGGSIHTNGHGTMLTTQDSLSFSKYLSHYIQWMVVAPFDFCCCYCYCSF